ncbi:hypothetical protein [Frigoriflavimonas asaccharolytica]|uniref:Uncharacterized protein n=1 Tax=Frigoriflavimonas asaccharolytica TaxID=2735899 RepID=A0A8J8G9T8_9FLAO|nr:hypothetical protein [Frigoriflavimonas asaccharolytica]NRS93984.1 hypothetical protein [Frigoriflavimonas asaccharolytica]
MKEANLPEIGADEILRKAFKYWSKTLVYQLIFSLVYLSILLFVLTYFATDYGLLDQYISAISKANEDVVVYQNEVNKIAENPNFISFYYIILGTLVFLYPLNIGFFQIYRKMDLGEKTELKDLFVGYLGINFFKFISFYLFWFIIFSYTAPTIILGLMWILITLFTGPLMFFMNKRIFETFSLNFHAIRKYPMIIFVGLLVAFIFKIVGSLLLLPLLFVLPFSNAMIYTLYSQIFHENNEKNVV